MQSKMGIGPYSHRAEARDPSETRVCYSGIDSLIVSVLLRSKKPLHFSLCVLVSIMSSSLATR